jgi:hypothetical protein
MKHLNKYALVGVPSLVVSFWLMGHVMIKVISSFPLLSTIYVVIWLLTVLFYFPIAAPLFFVSRSKISNFKNRLSEVVLKSLVTMHIVYYTVLLLAYLECFTKLYCNDSEPISSYGLLLFVWLINVLTVAVGSLIVTSVHHWLKRRKA